MTACRQPFPVLSSSQSRAWPPWVLVVGASSAKSFERVAAAAAVVVADDEVEVEVVEAGVGVGVGVGAGAGAGAGAGVDGLAVGGRSVGKDATEKEDATADEGEEGGEERVQHAGGVEDRGLEKALEDIQGGEEDAYAFYKVVDVVGHEVVAHMGAGTGEVPSRESVPHLVAAGKVGIEGEEEHH
jgi:hypothetical protein